MSLPDLPKGMEREEQQRQQQGAEGSHRSRAPGCVVRRQRPWLVPPESPLKEAVKL